MDNRNFRFRQEMGFTLFEVVVAVALLGLILAASFGLIGVGLRSLRASGETTRAVLLAKQKLYEASLMKAEPGATIEGSNAAYRWITEMIPEDSAGDLPARLLRLRVRVSWAGGRVNEKGLEIVTLFASVDEGKLGGLIAREPGDFRRPAGEGAAVRRFSSSRTLPAFRRGFGR